MTNDDDAWGESIPRANGIISSGGRSHNQACRRWRTKRPGKGKGDYLFNHRALAWVKQRAPILCTCRGAVKTIVKTRIRTLFRRPVPIPLAAEGAR